MNVQEYFVGALTYEYYSLALLLDFLLNEKQAVQLTDTKDSLERYTADRNAQRMNRLLDEYEHRKGRDPNWILYSLYHKHYGGHGHDKHY